MTDSPVINAMMWFFIAFTLSGVWWATFILGPPAMARRTARQADGHHEALLALAEALSRPQPAEHRARLQAQYDSYQAALLTLRPGATVPSPATAGDRLAA